MVHTISVASKLWIWQINSFWGVSKLHFFKKLLTQNGIFYSFQILTTWQRDQYLPSLFSSSFNLKIVGIIKNFGRFFCFLLLFFWFFKVIFLVIFCENVYQYILYYLLDFFPDLKVAQLKPSKYLLFDFQMYTWAGTVS